MSETNMYANILKLWGEQPEIEAAIPPDQQPHSSTEPSQTLPQAPAAMPQADSGFVIPPTPAERQQQQGIGFTDTLLDIGGGIIAGADDAVGETVNLFTSDAVNLFMDEESKVGDVWAKSTIKQETTAGRIAKSITQFAVGFIGAGKFLKAAKLLQGAGKAATIGRGMTQGAIADFTVFDANEARLSNIIQNNPALANPITEFLAATPEDSAMLGRFKNVIEGMGLGVAGDALIAMVKGMKAVRVAPTVAEAEEAVVRTADEVDTLAAQAKTTSEELAAKVDAVVSGDTRVAGEALEGISKVDIDVHGLDPEQVAENVSEAEARMEMDVADDLLRATPSEKGAATKASLNAEEMGLLIRDAMNSGRNFEDALDEVMIGNLKRITFKSQDELKLHGEYILRQMDQTLKGKGVQTHQMVLDSSTEWLESMSLRGLLDAAAHDKATMRDLAARAIAYKIAAKTAGQKLLAMQRHMDLHGATPTRLEEFEKASRSFQDLSLASKDITTASARITSAGRIEAGYLKPELLAAILKATDGNVEKWLKIQNLSRTRKAFNTLQEIVINGLLSSPKTHIVNITGNLLKSALMPAEKMLGGAIMGNRQMVIEGAQTYTGLMKYLGESWKAARMAVKMGDNILDRGHKVMDSNHQTVLGSYEKIRARLLEQKMAQGKMPGSLGPLEELQVRAMSWIGSGLGLPSRALLGVDEWFKQLNYRANLYGKLTAKGITDGKSVAEIAELVERGMGEAFDATGRGLDAAALRYGQETTWTQALRDDAYFNGGLGQGITNLVNAYPPLRLVMPFIRTPTNLIRDFVAHTPGLNFVTKRFRDAHAAGGEAAAHAYGATATGALLWTTAIGLAASGKMTGGYPRDPATRQAWIDSGIEPYSFRIGNTYVSFARLDPFSTFFGIAADYAEYSRNWSDSAKGNWASGGILALASNLLSKSYLTGLTDLIDALGDQSVDSQAMQKYMQRSVTMFIPYSSGLRFSRQLVDDPMREVRSSFDSILNSIPGTSTLLPERRSWITGKAVSYNAFWGEHRDDAVANELARLGDNLSIGAPGRRLKGVVLDGEQYSRLCEIQGTIKIGGLTQHERLSRLMRSAAYDLGRKRIPDSPGDMENPRTIMVEKVLRQYRTAAQKALLREDNALRTAADREQKSRIAARRGDTAKIQELLTMPK